jgi:hypothetical protein
MTLADAYMRAQHQTFMAKESAANELAWTIVREMHGGSIPPGDDKVLCRNVERLADALEDFIK